MHLNMALGVRLDQERHMKAVQRIESLKLALCLVLQAILWQCSISNAKHSNE